MSEKAIEPDKLLDAFGLVIGFVCPGFLTIWCMNLAAPGLKIPGADLTGGFVFLFIAAIGIGVLLSAFRLVLVNEFLFKRFAKMPPDKARDYAEAARRDAGIEAAYRDIRAMYFPYFQFFSHVLVAAPLVFAAWVIHNQPSGRELAIGGGVLVVVAIVLYHNAAYSMRRFLERRNSLLKEAKA